MYIKCNCESCRHWSTDGGDFIGEGGCTLDTITISDNTVTAAGCLPMCEDYKERTSDIESLNM